MSAGPEQVKGLQAQRYQEALGQRLREARVDAKRSLSDVALYLGVSKQLIHVLEMGKSRASAWQVAQVAEFTGADCHWLLTGKWLDENGALRGRWAEGVDNRPPRQGEVSEGRKGV